MNEELGKNFQALGARDTHPRGVAARGAVRVLVVDPILGSRFALMQAATQPGFVVDATASTRDALRLIERTSYSLVIAEADLGTEDGLSFLERLRVSEPGIARALVSDQEGLEWKRQAIDRGGLAFLLSKPWSPEGLRHALRELFDVGAEFAQWDRVESVRPAPRPRKARAAAPADVERHHEVVLRGLLAGLNACESEPEIFELLHAELAVALGVRRWLWVDEAQERAGRLAGDWAVETGIPLEALDLRERACLRQAGRSLRVARIDDGATAGGDEPDLCCVGWALRSDARRALTGLVWADRSQAAALVSMMRGLQGGLQAAFQRVRDAERRATAARALARRVSEELRMPVGALAHAIDRLRGEAERAGLSSEWVDRISSESERVARAVEHLEGEILRQPLRAPVA